MDNIKLMINNFSFMGLKLINHIHQVQYELLKSASLGYFKSSSALASGLESLQQSSIKG